MTAQLSFRKSDGCFVVTYGDKVRVFRGGIDSVIQNASIWIRGGCK